MEVTATFIGDLHFDNLELRGNIVKLGVILMVPKVKSELKYNVHNNGDHLVIKRGGQSDLLFNILDVSRNIVIWGVISM